MLHGAPMRPVVISGGLFTSGESYGRLVRQLESLGFEVTVNPVGSRGFAPVQQDATRLAETVDAASRRFIERGGDGRVTIVGHSKGGITARWYLQRMGGIDHVDQLLTLGTPHQGTSPVGPHLSRLAAAHLGIAPVSQLVTDGPVMRGLVDELPAFMTQARAAQPDFRITSIAGDVDLPLLHGTDGFIKVHEARIVPAALADARGGAAALGLEDVVVRANHQSLARSTDPDDEIAQLVADRLLRRA